MSDDMLAFYGDGFDELEKLLESYSENVENVLDVLEEGAKELVSDVRKLPKPRSSWNTPGYTHLIDTFTSKRTKSEIEVGWGKYYGPMVEHGTKRARATPHLSVAFNANKEKYYKKMIEKIHKGE